jgi:hypothetical protein
MLAPDDEKIRIFISYSHEDRKRAQKICSVLKKMDFKPVWDEHIRVGASFTDEIKKWIMRSHAFLPLLTRKSRERPWVHQETGFAMALNVPVIPLAISGEVPGEMIAEFQALQIDPNMTRLEEKLRAANIMGLVERNPSRNLRIMDMADLRQMRATMITESARQVLEMGGPGKVRQKGTLSSFSIPDKPVSNEIWNRQYEDLDEYTKRLYRMEREALETHASQAGARLMVFPEVSPQGLKPDPMRARRVEVLLDFLISPAGEKTEVVLSDQAVGGNLLILGNWFMAGSMAPRPGQGYRHTVFNWHAPTVQKALREFDEDFNDILESQGLTPENSRQHAIVRIKALLNRLPSGKGPRKRRAGRPRA